jgi:hypothetical protein
VSGLATQVTYCNAVRKTLESPLLANCYDANGSAFTSVIGLLGV